MSDFACYKLTLLACFGSRSVRNLSLAWTQSSPSDLLQTQPCKSVFGVLGNSRVRLRYPNTSKRNLEMLKLSIAAAVAMFALVGCSDDGAEAPPAAGGAGVGGGMPVGGTGGGGMTTGGAGGMTTGGAGGGTPPGGPSYAATVEPIFEKKCALSCHAPGKFGGPGMEAVGSALDLSKGAGYMSLKGMSLQATIPLVGANAEGSYLWHKLDGTQATVTLKPDSKAKPPSGIGMPLGAKLPADELAIVKAWIDGGAAR
jgi:hypothetical protein